VDSGEAFVFLVVLCESDRRRPQRVAATEAADHNNDKYEQPVVEQGILTEPATG